MTGCGCIADIVRIPNTGRIISLTARKRPRGRSAFRECNSNLGGRRFARQDFARNILACRERLEVIVSLHCQPRSSIPTKVARQALRRICAHPATLLHDFMDASGGHAKSQRKGIYAQPDRSKEFLAENLTRVHRSHAIDGSFHCHHPSVIVHNLHGAGSGFGPDKADPPLVIDADAPLSSPIAFQRLQPISRWRSQKVQRLCCIQHRQLSSNFHRPAPWFERMSLCVEHESSRAVPVPTHSAPRLPGNQ